MSQRAGGIRSRGAGPLCRTLPPWPRKGIRRAAACLAGHHRRPCSRWARWHGGAAGAESFDWPKERCAPNIAEAAGRTGVQPGLHAGDGCRGSTGEDRPGPQPEKGRRRSMAASLPQPSKVARDPRPRNPRRHDHAVKLTRYPSRPDAERPGQGRTGRAPCSSGTSRHHPPSRGVQARPRHWRTRKNLLLPPAGEGCAALAARCLRRSWMRVDRATAAPLHPPRCD